MLVLAMLLVECCRAAVPPSFKRTCDLARGSGTSHGAHALHAGASAGSDFELTALKSSGECLSWPLTFTNDPIISTFNQNTMLSDDYFMVYGGLFFADAVLNGSITFIFDVADAYYVVDLVAMVATATPSGPPGKRVYAATATVGSTMFMLYGSAAEDALATSNTWMFDTTTMEWTVPVSWEPPPRDGATAAAVGTDVYMFGGSLDPRNSTSRRFLSELWRLDTTSMTWENVSTSGDIPSPRANAILHYVSERHTLVLVGGHQDVSTGIAAEPSPADVYSLDVATMQWTFLAAGVEKLGTGTTVAHFGSRLQFYGGCGIYCSPTPTARDVVSFDLNDNSWVPKHPRIAVQPGGPPIIGNSSFAVEVCADEANVMWVFDNFMWIPWTVDMSLAPCSPALTAYYWGVIWNDELWLGGPSDIRVLNFRSREWRVVNADFSPSFDIAVLLVDDTVVAFDIYTITIIPLSGSSTLPKTTRTIGLDFPMRGVSVVRVQDNMFVFGGSGASAFRMTNRLIIVDCYTYEHTVHYIPGTPARYRPALFLMDDKLLIAGGLDFAGGEVLLPAYGFTMVDIDTMTVEDIPNLVFEYGIDTSTNNAAFLNIQNEFYIVGITCAVPTVFSLCVAATETYIYSLGTRSVSIVASALPLDCFVDASAGCPSIQNALIAWDSVLPSIAPPEYTVASGTYAPFTWERHGFYMYGVGSVVISGSGVSRCVDLGGPGNVFRLSNIAMEDCLGTNGGGLRVRSSSIFLEDVTFRRCTASFSGGALYMLFSSEVQMTGCTFEGNSASVGGAMSLERSEAIIATSSFQSSAAQDGGAVYCTASEVSFSSCSFTGNTGDNGGALMFFKSQGSLDTVSFTDNHAERTGGALALDSDSSVTMHAITVTQNSLGPTGDGAGMSCHQAEATVTDSSFTFNEGVSNRGGGLYALDCNVQFSSCNITDNTAAAGGGVYAISGTDVMLDDCLVLRNSAEDGGGLYLTGSTGRGSTASINGNTASNDGGAVYMKKNVFGEAVIDFEEDTNIVGNSAGLRGGAIAIIDRSNVRVVGTITANTALIGGGLFWDPYAAPVDRVIAAPFGNTAGAYGDDFATPLTRLEAETEQYPDYTSGQPFDPVVVILAKDFHGNTVSTFEDLVTVSSSGLTSASGTSAQAQRGYARFEELIVLAPPSSLSSSLNLTALTQDDVGMPVPIRVTIPDCPPGSGLNEQDQCIPCAPGTNATSSNSPWPCAPCPPGSYANVTGTTSCPLCAPGSHASASQQVECEPCALGSYSASPGQVRCSLCPPGSAASLAGSPACKPCPAGRTASASGATECSVCTDGVALGGTECRACPGEATCSNGIAAPRVGFWRDPQEDKYYPCQDESALACPPDGCGEGHKPDSFLCAECQDVDGVRYERSGPLCRACNQPALYVFIVLLAVGAIVAFVAVNVSKTKARKFGDFANVIAMSHLQQLSIIISSGSFQGSSLREVLAVSDLASPNPRSHPVNCLLGWQTLDSYSTIFSIMLIVSLALLGTVAALRARQSNADMVIKLLLVFQFMMYPSFSRATLSMLSCRSDVGEARLRIDPSVMCWKGAHIGSGVLAIIALIGHIAAFPAITAGTLFRNRDDLDDPSVMAKYEFFYGGFYQRAFWFESLVLLRKSLLASVVAFSGSPDVQAVLLGLTLSGSFVVTKIVQPYRIAQLNDLDIASLGLNIATVFIGFLESRDDFLVLVLICHIVFLLYCAFRFVESKLPKAVRSKLGVFAFDDETSQTALARKEPDLFAL